MVGQKVNGDIQSRARAPASQVPERLCVDPTGERPVKKIDNTEYYMSDGTQHGPQK